MNELPNIIDRRHEYTCKCNARFSAMSPERQVIERRKRIERRRLGSEIKQELARLKARSAYRDASEQVHPLPSRVIPFDAYRRACPI